jgi:glycosyltransferase involved in cell wall biosynthesis
MLKVSVIMTTHNSKESFLPGFASIAEQNYPDLEVVIIDGASTDGTAELIRKAERASAGRAGFTVRWISEPDGGIYEAMNKGIAGSSGDIIGVMNDRFTSKDAISRMVSAIEASGADGVHTDLVYTDHGRCVRYWHMGDGDFRDGHYRALSFGWLPAHPTLYLRRSVYEKYGTYDTSLKSSSDYEYMLRILSGKKDRAVRLCYLPEVLVDMSYGGTSNGGFSGYFRNMAEAREALIREGYRPAWPVILCRILRTLDQYRQARRYDAVKTDLK